MSLDLFEVSFLFIGLQSLLFAIVLFVNSKGGKAPSILLGSFLLTMALQSSVLLYGRQLGANEMPFAYLCIFGFLYGPLLWMYAQSLIYKDFKFTPLIALHFLAAATMLVSALFGFNLCGVIGSLFYPAIIVYTVLIIRMLVAYRKVLIQTQSTNEDIKLKWLQWVVIIFTGVLLTDIYEHFIGNLEVVKGLSFVNFMLIILINGIYYKGLRHPALFQGVSAEERALVENAERQQTPTKEHNEDLEQLKKFMETEKPYLDPRLTLSQLAQMVDIPSRKLSEMINDNLGQNFMDLINTYRIEEAKIRLLSPKDSKETVLEVMYDVGFNSKSSFNTIFKKKVGKTPSEFKNGGLRSGSNS